MRISGDIIVNGIGNGSGTGLVERDCDVIINDATIINDYGSSSSGNESVGGEVISLSVMAVLTIM